MDKTPRVDMPNSDLSKSTTIDQVLAALEADPTFVKEEGDESETSFTFVRAVGGRADHAARARSGIDTDGCA